LTMTCRTMPVQANLITAALVSGSPNTQRSFPNLLRRPKYRSTIQRFGLLGWVQVGPG
jgi:hypothetical protein